MSATLASVLTSLEELARTGIELLPAGVAGVEYGWRPAHELQGGTTPHVFFFDVTETSEDLICRQKRITVRVRGQIVRVGDTYAQALADWEAFRTLVVEFPDLFGALEQGTLELDDVEDSAASDTTRVQSRVVTFVFTGQGVI